MGFLNKLFHKKDEFNLDSMNDPKLDAGLNDPLAPNPDKGFPSFEESMNAQGHTVDKPTFTGGLDRSNNGSNNSNFEQEVKLLSSKMDTLIAKMDNMNQRIANIERIAIDAQK